MKKVLSLVLLSLVLISCGNNVDNSSSSYPQIESIEIVDRNIDLLVGETYQLHFETTPKIDETRLKWSTGSENIAIVDDYGCITGTGVGKTEIEVDYFGTKALTNVNVYQNNGVLNFNVTPKNNENVSLCNDFVNEFLQDYKMGDSEPYQGLGDIYQPKPVHLTWSFSTSFSSYEIRLSLSQQMNDFVFYHSEKNDIEISDLFVGKTYFWQISAYNSNFELMGRSKISSFNTLEQPRTIDIDGVSNCRDIGGRTTVDSKRVKQGMIYRSANLDEITDSGKEKFLNGYKIKTDLDLRVDGEGTAGRHSPVDFDLNYINMAGLYWIGGLNGCDCEENWFRMEYVLEPFADINNYPIIFHCAIGQDRTGSLAIILEGLLGMLEEDIAIDYELSSFSSAVWDPLNPIMVSDKLYYQYRPFINYLKTFGQPQDSFQMKVECYVKEVGLSDEDIASIRSIMLEDC